MKKILITLVALVLSGCATWSTTAVDGVAAPVKAAAVQTNASDIRLTEADITDRKYEPLGDIAVTVNKTTLFHPDPTKEMVNDKLKTGAAKLGANAVIFVRYGKVGVGAFSWGSLEGKGRAIRYIN